MRGSELLENAFGIAGNFWQTMLHIFALYGEIGKPFKDTFELLLNKRKFLFEIQNFGNCYLKKIFY